MSLTYSLAHSALVIPSESSRQLATICSYIPSSHSIDDLTVPISSSTFCTIHTCSNAKYILLVGLFFVLPCIETYTKVDLRTITLDVPPQEVVPGVHDLGIMMLDVGFSIIFPVVFLNLAC